MTRLALVEDNVFVKRFPNTQRALTELGARVAEAEDDELSKEMNVFRDSLIEVLMDCDHRFVVATPVGETLQEPELDSNALLAAFEGSPRLRAYHTRILLALVTDMQLQRPKIVHVLPEELPKPLEFSEVAPLAPRAQQYFDALTRVWNETLGISTPAASVTEITGQLSTDQTFALRFLVFADVAAMDLGPVDGKDPALIKTKIEALIPNEDEILNYRTAVRAFFPGMTTNVSKGFHRYATQHFENTDWWKKLEPLLKKA